MIGFIKIHSFLLVEVLGTWMATKWVNVVPMEIDGRRPRKYRYSNFKWIWNIVCTMMCVLCVGDERTEVYYLARAAWATLASPSLWAIPRFCWWPFWQFMCIWCLLGFHPRLSFLRWEVYLEVRVSISCKLFLRVSTTAGGRFAWKSMVKRLENALICILDDLDDWMLCWLRLNW